MRSALIGLTAVGMVVSLTACGGYKADKGTVIEHVFEPETHSVIVSCSPVGKITVCNSIPTTDPACWKIRLEDQAGHRGSYCLKQVDWEALELGDYVEMGSND